MKWNDPEWLDEYDIVTATTPEQLLKQLNREGRWAAADKHGRWEAVGITTDVTGVFHALRRRGVWAVPKDAEPTGGKAEEPSDQTSGG
jgi:hypothetical protein